jgi:hypothetical protein
MMLISSDAMIAQVTEVANNMAAQVRTAECVLLLAHTIPRNTESENTMAVDKLTTSLCNDIFQIKDGHNRTLLFASLIASMRVLERNLVESNTCTWWLEHDIPGYAHSLSQVLVA